MKESTKPETTLEFKEKYTYNKDTDTYVTPLKGRGKPLVLSGAKHRAIIRSLSGMVTPALTVEETAIKYKVPVKYLEEYKKIHSITRDSLPLSQEEVIDLEPEQSAQQLMEERRFSISEAFQKLDWKETQKDAASWREFQAGTYDPVSLALETWTPPKLSPRKTPEPSKVKDKVLVIGLSDLHYGSASNAKYMFNRPDWSTEKTVEAVEKYCDQILRTINERTYDFKKIIILGLGDLIHSVNGKTARGTELKYDVIREEQFDFALTSLTAFINRIATIAPLLEVHSVYGNHNYEAEMGLFRALEMYFKPQNHVSFFHYSSRPAAFREGNTLFLLDHGADSVERAYVPTTESKLQLHVQSLLLSNPEMLVGTKERLFLTGDKHHWEHLEYGDFQFIMFSTIIGGDEHANVNNLRNRPRQSCLVIDDSGLRETVHVYFD